MGRQPGYSGKRVNLLSMGAWETTRSVTAQARKPGAEPTFRE